MTELIRPLNGCDNRWSSGRLSCRFAETAVRRFQNGNCRKKPLELGMVGRFAVHISLFVEIPFCSSSEVWCKMQIWSQSIRNWAAGVLQAAFWIGVACAAWADEPKPPPAAPARAISSAGSPAEPERKYNAAEKAQLDEAKRLNTHAVELYRAGQYGEAVPLAEQAIAIRKRLLGEKHPAYANSLNNLALLYQAQGNPTKAEPLYLEALAIDKQALGQNHPDYATDLINLAALYRAQGHYAKAEPLLVTALAIYKQASGEKSTDYATSVNNLAILYRLEGNYAKAEPLLVEALAIRKQLLGEKHPDYAQSLNNLAGLYWVEGNYAKAEPLFIEALAIRKQVLGEKHPDYALRAYPITVQTTTGTRIAI